MELPHIGQNCSLKECNQLDFLPIKCDACSRVFCIEHYRYEKHQCDQAGSRDVQVPVCPICQQPVGSKRDQPPDIAVSEHIDKFCKGNDVLRKTNAASSSGIQTNLKRCAFKSCKQKDIIYLECQDCKTQYCVKHRHPTDHLCPGPASRSITSDVADNWHSFKNSCSTKASSGMNLLKNKAQQISRSGQAALNRMSSVSESRNTNITGSERNNRNLLDLQGGLSEQEALDIAISNSISNNVVSNSESAQIASEGEDAALARALFVSEVEARQRGNTNVTSNQKANCILS